jgi:hypothetical protein
MVQHLIIDISVHFLSMQTIFLIHFQSGGSSIKLLGSFSIHPSDVQFLQWTVFRSHGGIGIFYDPLPYSLCFCCKVELLGASKVINFLYIACLFVICKYLNFFHLSPIIVTSSMEAIQQITIVCFLVNWILFHFTSYFYPIWQSYLESVWLIYFERKIISVQDKVTKFR